MMKAKTEMFKFWFTRVSRVPLAPSAGVNLWVIVCEAFNILYSSITDYFLR